MRCSCCMSDMRGSREAKESGGTQGGAGVGSMGGMGKEELAQQQMIAGRKEVGDMFTCSVDGMQRRVTEHTRAPEYQGKTYYFCGEVDTQACLKDPERYVKGKSVE